MSIKETVKNKKVLIWGYGREGQSTESFLRAFCKPAWIDLFQGTPAELDDTPYDIIVKSPGIVWRAPEMIPGRPSEYEEKKFAENMARYDRVTAKLTSQTEMFLSEFSGCCIGVTGTKGKSTTASMLAHVLRKCTDKNVYLVGNIGIPCLDSYAELSKQDQENSIVVFEMSCHQLNFSKWSPHIAVFLNLYEEHLDYYGTVENYFRAKSHIITCQSEDDYAYVGENVPAIESVSNKQILTHEDMEKAGGPFKDMQLRLYGVHNRYNAYFVYKIATENYGCDPEKVVKEMESFDALPHRMQPLGEHNGIFWYDDSISTIPEATMSAAGSIPGAKTLIVGGMDRGISYAVLENFMRSRQDLNFVLMYATGRRIYEEIRDEGALPNVYPTIDLRQAVEAARRVTPKGMGAVLSPAAASYGDFKNFEERGDVFAQLVRRDTQS